MASSSQNSDSDNVEKAVEAPTAAPNSVALHSDDDDLDRQIAALSPEEYHQIEKKLKWKMDFQVVLLCCVLYLLSFLDRTNIGGARLIGLMEELKMSIHDYRIALTVLYPPYILFEIPSNLVLKKFGAARVIPGLVIMWGIVSTLQGIVNTKTGLFINRAFLGFTEAGILPGIVLYLTFFYKPSELQLRQALYFSGASLAGAFGGLLAAAISEINAADLRPWSWLFIIEGMFTVVFGILCLVIMPNGPHKLRGLTPIERRIALHRIGKGSGQDYALGQKHEVLLANKSLDQQALPPAAVRPVDKVDSSSLPSVPVSSDNTGNTDIDKVIQSFRWSEVVRAWTDPFVLILACLNFCVATGVYSLAFFAPTIIRSLNINDGRLSLAHTLLLTTPPFAAAFITSIALGVVSDRTRWRGGSCALGFLLSIIGFSLAYASDRPAAQYAGTVIMAMGSFSLPSVTLSWISTATWGHYKRATATATMIVFTNSGGIASTWLQFPSSGSIQYAQGFLVNLILNIVGLLLTLLLEAYVWYDRREKASGRRDWRVSKAREQFPGATDEQVREYLGDQSPDFKLEY